MSSFRSTGVLALVIAMVIGYTVYDYKSGEKSAAQKAEAEKVIAITEAEISRMRVVRPTETMVLKHEGGAWSLTEPFADEVEGEAATAYLNSFAQEKATAVDMAGKAPTDWTQYHLSPPGAAVEITKTDGQTVSFSVSRTAAFDGSYFVRRGDELLLGTAAWSRVLEKGANQLRSKKILRRAGPVTKIHLVFSHTDLKDRFTLVRGADKSWTIPEAPGLKIDSTKVDEFIENLKQTRALDFQPEKLDEGTRRKYSLNAPVIKLTMEFEKQEPALPPWTLELGAEKDAAHYGVSSAVDATFKLSTSDGERLLRGRNDFRDGKAPFRLAVEEIREIRVKAEPNSWTFTKDGSEWKVAGGDGAKPHSENLQKLVEKISAFEAKEFLPATRAAKANLKREIEFRGPDGKSMLKVSVGDEFTPGTGANKSSQLVYAKSSLASELLAVPAGDVKEIAFDQLVAAPTEGQTSQQSSQR